MNTAQSCESHPGTLKKVLPAAGNADVVQCSKFHPRIGKWVRAIPSSRNAPGSCTIAFASTRRLFINRCDSSSRRPWQWLCCLAYLKINKDYVNKSVSKECCLVTSESTFWSRSTTERFGLLHYRFTYTECLYFLCVLFFMNSKIVYISL